MYVIRFEVLVVVGATEKRRHIGTGFSFVTGFLETSHINHQYTNMCVRVYVRIEQNRSSPPRATLY